MDLLDACAVEPQKLLDLRFECFRGTFLTCKMKDIRHKFGDINRFSLRFSYNFTSLIDLSLLVVVWLDL